MDLLTARTEIRSRLGEDTPDFWTDDELVRALNEGVRRFSQEEKWPWLYTLKTGITVDAGEDTVELEDNISFPRQFNLVITPEGGEPYMPKRVTPVEGTKLRVETRTSGDPRWYYLESTTAVENPVVNKSPVIRLVPEPSSDLSLEYQYIRLPGILTADTDELDIPEEYVGGPIAWATAQCWLKELNWNQKAKEQFELFATVLAAARKDHRRIAIDDGMAWGGEPGAPQTFAFRIPNTLGP